MKHMINKQKCYSSVTTVMCNLLGALVGCLELSGVGRAVDKESSALHLLLVVESYQTDVGIGEGGGASSDLLEDLRAIGASEHGELPH